MLACTLLLVLQGAGVQKTMAQGDQPDAPTFTVVLKNEGDTVALKCAKGCDWDRLRLGLPLEETVTINHAGLIAANESERDSSSSRFLFSLQVRRSGDTVKVKMMGTKGTWWKQLSFKCPEDVRRAFDQSGMTEVPPAYRGD